MIVALTILHVLVCTFLILVVLLQTGKGADLAAAFGGSSQTAFGARGAATLLTKLTTAAAIIFMLTSILLAMISTSAESVLEGADQTPVSAPALPGATPIIPDSPDSSEAPAQDAQPGQDDAAGTGGDASGESSGSPGS